MAKDLKFKIKNKQLAKAVGLDKLKAKLAGVTSEKEKKKPKKQTPPKKEAETQPEKRRIRAKSHSSFAPTADKALEEGASKKEFKVEAAQTPQAKPAPAQQDSSAKIKLGPTGRHVKDLLPVKKAKLKQATKETPKAAETSPPAKKEKSAEETKKEEKPKEKKDKKKVREFRDFKSLKKQMRPFDARDRAGLTEGDEGRWRKKRAPKQPKQVIEEQIVRPTSLAVRLPITVKELAALMKFKASELIAKLLMQGMPVTLNDALNDETVVQLLGQEFGCEITIDTKEEQRIRITELSISEEIAEYDPKDLVLRPPVVTFMGHVDHGKTSLIDKIRKSNLASAEAGAITQHMGAFKCSTAVGEITILDTPGHEAFSAMRARGAEVTDIVVLVIAGDEGIKEQTVEAIQHAKAAKVTIVVALNKCDKPSFNTENVYRELAENDLLPEAWGGQTITVNTSAVSGEGIKELLEMLALQAEVLELKANPKMRARGTVLESELHKGLGSVATVLVQNGSLKFGDALVFERLWGRVKTMHDEHGKDLLTAGPSTPVEITGLSGLPAAGDPFIVVESEKEARDIAETRATGKRESMLLQKKRPLIDLLQTESTQKEKKILKIILRGDVQGSVEALKQSILKIESEKATADVIFTGVGEVSESDIQLAAASKAVILGFHTKIEAHAETLIKELEIPIFLFDVIYRAVDEVKDMMQGLLDKLEEEKDTGKAEVKTTFKASQLGVIAGCLVVEGTIHRNHRMRVVRDGEVIWKGNIASIKRVQEDVREVKKGLECGIVLEGFNDLKEGDFLEAYEIIYLSQEL